MAEATKLTCAICGKEIKKGERVTIWSDGKSRNHFHRAPCWLKQEAEKSKAVKPAQKS